MRIKIYHLHSILDYIIPPKSCCSHKTSTPNEGKIFLVYSRITTLKENNAPQTVVFRDIKIEKNPLPNLKTPLITHQFSPQSDRQSPV